MAKRSKKTTPAKAKPKTAKVLDPEKGPAIPFDGTSRERAVPLAQGDFPHLAQTLLEATRLELNKNHQDGESVLKTMNGFPDSLIAQVLLDLTAGQPGPVLPLLAAAAKHESSQVILAVIQGLSRIRLPEAAAILEQIEDETRWDAEKAAIRKELNRARHRFKSMGIVPLQTRQGGLAADNPVLSGERIEATPLVSAERQFHQALVSNLDGVGNILGILVMRSPGSKYETAVLLFNDLDGLKDCKVYSFNKRQLDGFLKEWDLEATGVGLLPADRDYLDYLVNEHLPLNRTRNIPLAQDFVAWRRYFKIMEGQSPDRPAETGRQTSGQMTSKQTAGQTAEQTALQSLDQTPDCASISAPAHPETALQSLGQTSGQTAAQPAAGSTELPPHPIYALLSRNEVQEARSYLLPRTETLIQTPEMRNWLLEPGLMGEYAQKLLERRQSRIMVGGSFLKEYINKLAQEAAEQIYTPQLIKRYARRLEHMAFYFSLKGQENQARLALAASLDLQDTSNPVKNPVLWTLTLHSLDVLTDLLASGSKINEQGPLAADPEAEAANTDHSKTKTSPLILR